MPTMTHWTESTSYSVAHDCEMARIGGFDDHSHEHWMMIDTGAGFRERRQEAVERIMMAIEDGHEPGEVENQQEKHNGTN